jgi:hypothetical protein
MVPIRLAPRLRAPSALAETYGSALPRLDRGPRVRKAHTKKVTTLPPLSSAVCARRRLLTDKGEQSIVVVLMMFSSSAPVPDSPLGQQSQASQSVACTANPTLIKRAGSGFADPSSLELIPHTGASAGSD